MLLLVLVIHLLTILKILMIITMIPSFSTAVRGVHARGSGSTSMAHKSQKVVSLLSLRARAASH